MSSVIMTVSPLPFQFGCFYLFMYLIAAARTTNTIMSKSDKSGQPCLVPDLRGRALSFSSFSMMLAVGLS